KSPTGTDGAEEPVISGGAGLGLWGNLANRCAKLKGYFLERERGESVWRGRFLFHVWQRLTETLFRGAEETELRKKKTLVDNFPLQGSTQCCTPKLCCSSPVIYPYTGIQSPTYPRSCVRKRRARGAKARERGAISPTFPGALNLWKQESQQSSADFRFYIENHTRNPDDLSRKQVRIYQLYSRTTGRHVQILGKKINANGDDGGKYALLVVETETFGSHIRIKGKESEHYICMNEKGKIVGRPDGRKQECVFVEEFLENNYTALVSAKYKGWYLGFNRKGRPKKGSRTTQRQQEVHFMKRQPKGVVDPLEEFRFTTVTKRTRRARRLKPNSKRN
uniref:Fibroblast growth factor n=1 Tax=Amphiprion ocellaris TaxID=80972 RepID=A0AAQ5Z6P4_AMPOC